MNLQHYAPKAMRTAKILNKEDMLAHGGLGVCTEAGELANTICRIVAGMAQRTDRNISEELGDAAWFGVYVAFAANIDLAAVDSVLVDIHPSVRRGDAEMMLACLALAAAAEKIGTPCKAHKYYGKELEMAKLSHAIDLYFLRLVQLTKFFNLDFADILRQNIQKLIKRYPDQYTDAAAIERADKVEEDGVDQLAEAAEASATAKGTPWPFPSSAKVGGV